jgi:C4-type Zn-finger protein
MDPDAGQLVDLAAVNAALVAKGLPVECPSCEQGVWGTTERLALVPMDGPTRSLENAVEAVCLICQHCGFVKLHAAPTLMGG